MCVCVCFFVVEIIEENTKLRFNDVLFWCEKIRLLHRYTAFTSFYSYYIVIQLLHRFTAFIAVLRDITIVFRYTNELQDFALTTQQRKFLFAALSMDCSWCCKTRGV